jgi:hypothetical protein
MTLDDALTAYAAGLDAEMGLLQQVAALAADQRHASSDGDLDALAGLADRRAALMTALAEVESRIQPLRRLIIESLPHVTTRPGFGPAQARHREAQALVGRIAASDLRLVDELQAALVDRRQLAQALETGGATLAAYRRVLAPTIASAELVDRLG